MGLGRYSGIIIRNLSKKSKVINQEVCQILTLIIFGYGNNNAHFNWMPIHHFILTKDKGLLGFIDLLCKHLTRT